MFFFIFVTSGVFYGSRDEGYYNHAAMLHYHKQLLTVSWKNAPLFEDTPGQRVLYSQSTNGRDWSQNKILFPNMSTDATPVAQFAGPYAVIRDRLYATATPAIIADGDAQGAQWCLWPDGLDPRYMTYVSNHICFCLCCKNPFNLFC